MDTVTKTVRALGINATYLGYRYLIAAVYLVSENEDILLSVCNRLYPSVAEQFKTTSDNVERNLRTVINICWERGDRKFLKSIFPYPLLSRPSASELIDVLVGYCKTAS